MTNMFAKTACAALLTAMTFGAGISASTTHAEASEHCKKVYIQVTNSAGPTIKVIDVDYWDSSAGKWRSKAIKNRAIHSGQAWSWRKRLEKVGSERTKLRIKYRIYLGKKFNKWSKVQTRTTGSKFCTRGTSFHTDI